MQIDALKWNGHTCPAPYRKYLNATAGKPRIPNPDSGKKGRQEAGA
jgi:hypothetical protein